MLVKTAPFLGVTGKLEARDDVVHLIADELWTPRLKVQPQHGRSRDFHSPSVMEMRRYRSSRGARKHFPQELFDTLRARETKKSRTITRDIQLELQERTALTFEGDELRRR